MSWNNTLSAPNWSGIKTIGSISPINSSVINASTINVSSLNANFISSAVANISSINTNSISSATAFISSINGISIESFSGSNSASNWYTFPAQGNVTATLGLFGIPLYSISNFLNLTVGNSIIAQGGSISAGLNVGAGVSVAAPLGSFNTVNAESVQVSVTNETAAVDIYGASLVAGNNALYVEGGTTLTGGGVVHGVTIGALQVAGADTNRIDVVPLGIDITTIATPISIASFTTVVSTSMISPT
jgi:hypothetical protein